MGAVQQFAEHFRCSPEQLGPEHLRRYQVFLLQEEKLEPSTVEIRISALRFLYKRTLRRRDLAYDDLIFLRCHRSCRSCSARSMAASFVAEAVLTMILVLTVLGSTDISAPVRFAGIGCWWGKLQIPPLRS